MNTATKPRVTDEPLLDAVTRAMDEHEQKHGYPPAHITITYKQAGRLAVELGQIDGMLHVVQDGNYLHGARVTVLPEVRMGHIDMTELP